MREIFVATAFICTITDITYGKIYNFCIVPALLAGGVCRIATGGVRDIPALLLSVSLPALLLWPFCRLGKHGFFGRGGLAAGDIKLLTALSVQLPAGEFIPFFVTAFAAAGILAVWKVIHERNLRATIPLALPIGIAAALQTVIAF